MSDIKKELMELYEEASRNRESIDFIIHHINNILDAPASISKCKDCGGSGERDLCYCAYCLLQKEDRCARYARESIHYCKQYIPTIDHKETCPTCEGSGQMVACEGVKMLIAAADGNHSSRIEYRIITRADWQNRAKEFMAGEIEIVRRPWKGEK